MTLIDALLEDLPDCRIIDVRLGLHWTAVVAEAGGERRCGLSAGMLPVMNTGQSRM